MDSRWFKGVKDREKRKEQLLSYRTAFNTLAEVLYDLKKKEACRDYNSPNWAYQQISHNEYNQALDEIIKLITIKE